MTQHLTALPDSGLTGDDLGRAFFNDLYSPFDNNILKIIFAVLTLKGQVDDNSIIEKMREAFSQIVNLREDEVFSPTIEKQKAIQAMQTFHQAVRKVFNNTQVDDAYKAIQFNDPSNANFIDTYRKDILNNLLLKREPLHGLDEASKKFLIGIAFLFLAGAFLLPILSGGMATGVIGLSVIFTAKILPVTIASFFSFGLFGAGVIGAEVRNNRLKRNVKANFKLMEEAIPKDLNTEQHVEMQKIVSHSEGHARRNSKELKDQQKSSPVSLTGGKARQKAKIE